MKLARAMTIDRWIVDAAAQSPDKIALIFGDETIDYKTMASRIDAKTRQLVNAGIRCGDRVAWYGLNHPEVFILLFACARIGAIFVPLNWRLAIPEIAAIVADCSPKILIYTDEFVSQVRAIKGPAAVKLGGEYPAREDPETPNTKNEVLEDEAILIVYTSGSTGVPKGVVLTQKAITCNASMSIDAHQMSSEDIVFNSLPLFHVGGLNILPTPAFSLGATVLLHEKFEPDAACMALQQATLAITVPTVLQAIMNTDCWVSADFSKLRGISIGSTDVPLAMIDAVHGRGIPMIQVYGATETSPFAIYQTLDEAFASAGSIGRAGRSCEIRLVSDGRDVPLGEAGEIWVKGDNVLREYWHNEELTQAQLLDGWWRSGDVATLDEDGYYWFTDRIKNMIISGGENIYPTEIERILRDIPGIKEVVVVGRPHEAWGEVPVAVLVADIPMTNQDVLGSLQDKLARFKHPKDVVFVEALPRNATGKIVTSEVRKIIN